MASSPPQKRHGHPPTDVDAVVVGQIVGASGLRGDLKVEPHTHYSRRFDPGSVLSLDGRPAMVSRSRKSNGSLVLKLDVVNDRTHAESLRGTYLTVHESQVQPLPDGSYYYFQIIDIAVWTDDGHYLGVVKEVLATGANDVYLVRDGGREVLVPAVDGVVLEVDPTQGRMIVTLPEGLR